MIIAFDVTDQTAAVSWRLASSGETGMQTVVDRKATELLAPFLHDLCKRFNEPLTAVGVVTGPGSFTGIRVGLSVALGLREALDIPVYGFTKFQLLAAVCQEPCTLLLPAGRKQVMRCALEPGRAGRAEVVDVDEAKAALNPLVLRPLGNMPDLPVFDQNLTDLVLQRMHSGDVAESCLEPLYVRPADATRGQTLLQKLLTPKA